MTVIQSLKNWLLTCPLLAGQRLNTNYLGPEPAEFALIEAPVNPIRERYLDGSAIRQKAVAITAVQDYSPDQLQQLAASGFWEELCAWVEDQIWTDNLPELDKDREVCSVEVTSSLYVFYTTAQTARYQVQVLITYTQNI